jgi:hypothetical protein
MKLLDRLKAYFGHKPDLDQPEAVPVSPLSNESETLSRVAQNLSWLPVYEEAKPLSLPPPACPPIELKDTTLMGRYEVYVAQAEQADPHSLTEEFRETGRQLAQELFSSVLDLSSIKGRDESLDIYWLLQCAAIVSLFADGPRSDVFLGYRKHVHSYKEGRMTSGQVWAFDLYVEAHTPEAESDSDFLERAAQSARPPSEPIPQASDMDELLSYLPKLYPGGVAIKTYVIDDRWPVYFDVVKYFYRVTANECWNDFNYLAHGAAIMLENEAYIAQASLADIQTMLTLCRRWERFCDGYNGSVIEKGYVLNVLNRLAVLREGLGAVSACVR